MTDPTPTAALVSALEAMLDMDERCNDTGVPADECDRIRAQARAALAARPSPSAGSLVEARDPNGCTIHDYLRVLVQAWGRYIASGCTNTSVHEYAVIALNDVCRLYPQSALAAVPPVVEPVALPCREKGQHLYACVWCNVASVTAPPTTEPPAPTPPTTEPVVRCVTCGMTSLGWLHARENWGTTWDMQDGREQTGHPFTPAPTPPTTEPVVHILPAEPGTSIIGDWEVTTSITLPPACSNCGQPLTAWACGPGHAIARDEKGLQWDGIEPTPPPTTGSAAGREVTVTVGDVLSLLEPYLSERMGMADSRRLTEMLFTLATQPTPTGADRAGEG